MKTCTMVTAGLLALTVVTGIMPPSPYGNSKESAKRTMCLSNVKQQATAFLLYQEDGNGRFPRRDAWMDALKPYTRDGAPFHHPGPDWKRTYGYAFNAALSQVKEPKDPAATPLTYDSVNPIRNASDRVTSLPRPGRHREKNSVSYADGHARAVRPPGTSPGGEKVALR